MLVHTCSHFSSRVHVNAEAAPRAAKVRPREPCVVNCDLGLCPIRQRVGQLLLGVVERILYLAAAWDVEEVVDTTGAGDAFAAGVLAGLIRQYSAEHAARLGTLCAASVLGQMGARTQENLKLRAEDLLLL